MQQDSMHQFVVARVGLGANRVIQNGIDLGGKQIAAIGSDFGRFLVVCSDQSLNY